MSAPNKSYDPVEVTALHPDEVARMRAEALAAIEAASSLDELKKTRLAHAGDRSPLALANREIGALPPHAKAEAGKRVGGARRDVSEALKRRQAELEEERDQRVLVEEAVDVTLPWDRAPRGAPASADHDRRAHDRRLRLHGLRGRRRARGRGRVVQLRRPQLPARAPGARDAGHLLRGVGGVRAGLRTHTSPVQIRALLTRSCRSTSSAPDKTFRTDELDATHSPVFHQMEGLVVDEGITMADLRGAIDRVRGPACSARA